MDPQRLLELITDIGVIGVGAESGLNTQPIHADKDLLDSFVVERLCFVEGRTDVQING